MCKRLLGCVGVALAVGAVAATAAETPASFGVPQNYATGAHPVSVAWAT